ncbi:hypothetical protein [Zunongwangia endophytica]|uniref:Photosynthesis system II assembly factor Ycf48/Hcf136-like domain-containing protein n=1 Tax=Zunongwangia endophytica TaxID=1808945 RepID=A0ABV8HFS6_9FLAO|nr:hypothetical protein [Zunongwangia endophytica]MDN3594104.1 hypothetical protein [Zunongwangia endophytica]
MKKYYFFLAIVSFSCSKDFDNRPEEKNSLSNKWTIEKQLENPLFSLWGINDCLYTVGGHRNEPDKAIIVSQENDEWITKENYEGEIVILDVEGNSCGEIYAVGSDGRLFSFNGDRWFTKTFENINFTNVSIINGKVYLSASNGFYLYRSNELVKILEEEVHFQDAWGDNDGNLYVVAFSGEKDFIFYTNGTDWRNMLEGSQLEGNFLSSIEGYNNEYIYASGSGGNLLFFNGEEWTKVLEDLGPVNDLKFFTGTTIYFTTGSTYNPGKIYSVNGGFYSLEYESTQAINGLWSNEYKGIYAVTSGGRIISNLLNQ